MSAISAQRRTPATRTPAAEASAPSLSAMALVRTVGQPEGGDECWRPQARLLPAAQAPVRIYALAPSTRAVRCARPTGLPEHRARTACNGRAARRLDRQGH